MQKLKLAWLRAKPQTQNGRRRASVITAIAVRADGAELIAAVSPAHVCVWQIGERLKPEAWEVIECRQERHDRIRGIQYATHDEVVIGWEGGLLGRYRIHRDTAVIRPIEVSPMRRAGLRRIALLSDGRVLSGYGDGAVWLWQPSAGHCTAVDGVGKANPVQSLAVSADGETVAVARRHSGITLLNGSLEHNSAIRQQFITDAAYLDDVLLVGDDMGDLSAYRDCVLRCRITFSSGVQAIGGSSCTFSVALANGLVIIGRVERHEKRLRGIYLPEGIPGSVAMTPDGRLCAVASGATVMLAQLPVKVY